MTRFLIGLILILPSVGCARPSPFERAPLPNLHLEVQLPEEALRQDDVVRAAVRLTNGARVDIEACLSGPWFYEFLGTDAEVRLTKKSEPPPITAFKLVSGEQLSWEQDIKVLRAGAGNAFFRLTYQLLDPAICRRGYGAQCYFPIASQWLRVRIDATDGSS